MNLQFTNEKGEVFSLGTISFNYLDEQNAFDEYQEDNDYLSDIIFKTTRPGELGIKIKTSLMLSIRQDLKDKILNFTEFLLGSKQVTAVIL